MVFPMGFPMVSPKDGGFSPPKTVHVLDPVPTKLNGHLVQNDDLDGTASQSLGDRVLCCACHQEAVGVWSLEMAIEMAIMVFYWL